MSKNARALMEKTRRALIDGRSELAFRCLSDMITALESEGIAPDSLADLESELAELRNLAAAVLSGQRQAVDFLRAAVEAARSLQTYDRTGRRQVTPITDHPARRF